MALRRVVMRSARPLVLLRSLHVRQPLYSPKARKRANSAETAPISAR
jgi:hypothetical protein